MTTVLPSTMPSGSRNWLLIVDYNLSRWTDVQRMGRYVAKHYGMMTLLIRSHPGERDFTIADHVIDLDPLAPGFGDDALRALRPWSGRIALGLVFSDDAVATGAHLLHQLGLRVDDPDLAAAAFSKAIYRDQEARCTEFLEPQGIYIPPYSRLQSRAEAEAFAARCPGGFVLKPSCEGNNRGVVFVPDASEVARAWDEVSPYLAGGIVGEGFIDFPREYSFDGVGHLTFVTEKLRAHGRYPVEIGQLVPARLNVAERALVTRAGRVANLLVGQSDGPFHNEIKLNADGRRAAVIEPNRRPAGMKIWSLAERVYGLSFYELWVESALGNALPAHLPAPMGQAATAMLGVARDGRLDVETLPTPDILIRHTLDRMHSRIDTVDWLDFAWLSPKRTRYPLVPRDNGDFPATVCFHTLDTGFDLHGWVVRFQSTWRAVLAEWMTD
jgi:hypothetical protein